MSSGLDRKQKEKLRFLLKARKRAEKVLAERRRVEQAKLEYKKRKETSQELKERYTQELMLLAQECGLLPLAEAAALQRGGCLTQQVSYYLDTGFSTNSMQKMVEVSGQAELRASYLALRVIWGQPEALKEAEIRVYKKGQVAFHNFALPIFPFIWKRHPQVLEKLFEQALQHPRKPAGPVKSDC